MGISMKHLIGYVIWNKYENLDWIFEGINQSFHPADVDLVFLLDNPQDAPVYSYRYRINSLNKKGFSVLSVCYTTVDTYKFPCQNRLMQKALGKGYRSIICPQDDQQIMDPYFISNLNNILDLYGEAIGVIGCRDGFDFGYGNMVSSQWSESEYDQPRLKNGDMAPVKIINDGPIVYPVSTIEKVGLNETELYHRFYIEDDYSMKCNEAGLQNLVMGNSLVHDRSKNSTASDHYSNNYGELDLIKFREKWKL